MKFTKTQHYNVLKVIQEAKRSAEEFSFVKRKGRINIIENRSQNSFVYFKKETAKFDPDTQRLVSGAYFLVFHSDMKEQSFPSFEDVIFSLGGWLKKISINNPE
jgi:hypothetical protein